jgi:iron complex outermembrane receptor protein
MSKHNRKSIRTSKVLAAAIARIGYLPTGSVLLLAAHTSLGGEPATSSTLEEVIVTAQRRDENLQSVPISMQVLSAGMLEDLNVSSFDDYAKSIPSMTFQTSGPGYTQIAIRGVSSGGSDWSGSLSTVATYLDEQPVTTNQGTLDLHIYDIARVEVLAGPQGTLYGASSEAGTLRIITNQPDTRKFHAGYDVQGSAISSGGHGFQVEGFINIPISANAAIRLVGWREHDPGFIDNVEATRTFPTSGVCIANFNSAPPGCVRTPNVARRNVNPVDTSGARAAVKWILNDNWTVKPSLMTQVVKSGGYAGSSFDPVVGDLKVSRFYSDDARDSWLYAGLAVEGKVGNWDLVYSAGALDRSVDGHADYSDYSLAYDAYLSPVITDEAGMNINPSQLTSTPWHYKKLSHELRVSSPREDRLRWVAGAFLQRQQHNVENRYQIEHLSPALWVTGWKDTWWLTQLERVDRDYAAFAEVSYDLVPQLTFSAGVRQFRYKNSMVGFFGYGAGLDALAGTSVGEASCFATSGVNGAPCTNLDKSVAENGHIPKLNLTYRIAPDKLVYATWSRGFRPGGVNRSGGAPYKSDTLTNYEIGWKTSWAGDRFRFNGALFLEEWKNFQFTFTGANGVGRIANAAQARVAGLEASIEWALGPQLTLSGGLAVLDPVLSKNYCGQLDSSGNAVTRCPEPLAPKGVQLPSSSRFKGNVAARYQVHIDDVEAYAQAALVYQSKSWADLRSFERDILGQQPSFALLDLAVGVKRDSYALEVFAHNALDRRAQMTRYSECAAAVCGPLAVYVVPAQPRSIGLRFSQKW